MDICTLHITTPTVFYLHSVPLGKNLVTYSMNVEFVSFYKAIVFSRYVHVYMYVTVWTKCLACIAGEQLTGTRRTPTTCSTDMQYSGEAHVARVSLVTAADIHMNAPPVPVAYRCTTGAVVWMCPALLDCIEGL